MAHYECVVVGGGLIGATAALGLAQQGQSVALLEAQTPLRFVPDMLPPDSRISALGSSSVALLERLGVWGVITALRCTPYRQLEVWEQGSPAILSFSSESLQLPNLGYMVENRVLQYGLWQRLMEENTLTVYTPVMLQQLIRVKVGWQLRLSDGRQLTASLVIGADGKHSVVRQQAGIGMGGWQYRQQCLLITVQTEQPQQESTWQCFYPSGPRAFLPLTGHWASLAWYDTPAQIRDLQALSLPQLSHTIQQAYPKRLGSVVATGAQAFRLERQHAARYILPGLVLVGDAAHTIHPLAGQGANLGFRDVAVLLHVLDPLRSLEETIPLESSLKRYQQRRYSDNRLMQSAMDLIYQSFSTQRVPLPWIRQLALRSVAQCPPLKQVLLRYALGLWSDKGG
jgi:3-demethoxyubiquinol 3-hydroxylase